MIDEDIEEEVEEEISNLEETIDKELSYGQKSRIIPGGSYGQKSRIIPGGSYGQKSRIIPGGSHELLEMAERGPTNKKRFLPFFNRVKKGDTCDKKELTSPVSIFINTSFLLNFYFFKRIVKTLAAIGAACAIIILVCIIVQQ